MRILTAAVVMLSLSGAAALAQGPAPMRAAVREACRADVATFCKGIQPGGGRIRVCLRANKDRLSEGCKSAIAAMIQARRAARAQQSTQQPGTQPAPAPAP